MGSVGADLMDKQQMIVLVWSVDINAKGDRIVVGAIFNDGNGSNSGQVRIYELDQWTLGSIRAAIDGELREIIWEFSCNQ